ncbi:DUF4336 domain-containing protein [Rhizobium sp. Root482]|uniref:DUF4336 domain-containing protein n=1 Tax=Rhizobium sp. Root482 TaxID=1736543 RepID=UPI0006FF5758|nr:DUF4336 domain-containing protein [Rhizobium sp. Root482]KQY20311.1 hypothetical protein ASD31_24050 [Rhizobium sp. Root482]
MTEANLYRPINTLKPVCDDVWIVDGPAIDFGPPLVKMSFPTRMTIVRLRGRDLLIHSPTPLTAALKAEVAAIGTPRWIIGPNKIHYWWIADWHAGFPAAVIYLAAGIVERAGERISLPHSPLDARCGYPWDDEIATLPIVGSFMTEVEFFHRASRTLVLTDFIENFEPHKLTFWTRLLTRLGGVSDPDGQMPRDMRLTFSRRRDALKQAMEEMIAWEPERVILAHGRWYRSNGAGELRRAFRWLLP